MKTTSAADRIYLAVQAPRIVFRFKDGGIKRSTMLVAAGLTEGEHITFPREFQTDYYRAMATSPAGWRLTFDDREFCIDARKVEAIDVFGFSQLAFSGPEVPEIDPLDDELTPLLKDSFDIDLPDMPQGVIKKNKIDDLLNAYDQSLDDLGCPSSISLPALFNDDYVLYFPSPLFRRPASGLFYLAYNRCRMVGLSRLAEAAFNTTKDARSLYSHIRGNLTQRAHLLPWDYEGRQAEQLSFLDRQLMAFLVQEIARERGFIISMEELGRLALFWEGQALLDTIRFFQGASEKHKMPVLGRIPSAHAFGVELLCIKYILQQAGCWPQGEGLEKKVAMYTKLFFPYHGAMVIAAYEKITGDKVTLDYLLSLPIPFDLFSAIDRAYAGDLH
jgi:hypothetical protein